MCQTVVVYSSPHLSIGVTVAACFITSSIEIGLGFCRDVWIMSSVIYYLAFLTNNCKCINYNLLIPNTSLIPHIS